MKYSSISNVHGLVTTLRINRALILLVLLVLSFALDRLDEMH